MIQQHHTQALLFSISCYHRQGNDAVGSCTTIGQDEPLPLITENEIEAKQNAKAQLCIILGRAAMQFSKFDQDPMGLDRGADLISVNVEFSLQFQRMDLYSISSRYWCVEHADIQNNE